MDYSKQESYDFLMSFMKNSDVYKNALEYLKLVYDIKDFDPLTLKIEED